MIIHTLITSETKHKYMQSCSLLGYTSMCFHAEYGRKLCYLSGQSIEVPPAP
jgi:hypothetical protein